MNKKGQYALEYLITYGWALIVIAIVVGVMIWLVSPGQSTERWQEEWQCTKWQKTGELIDCIATEPLDDIVNANCRNEMKCVEKKLRQCLITRKKECWETSYPWANNCKWIEIRECDQEAFK